MKARAKRIDNGEYVEGYYFPSIQGHFIDESGSIEGNKITTVDYPKISPSTLEYQIGGKWYTMEELEQAVSTSIDRDSRIKN